MYSEKVDRKRRYFAGMGVPSVDSARKSTRVGFGFTTLASANVGNEEKTKDYLAKILSFSNHLLFLINDILDMSRIESGKINLEEHEANLSDIVLGCDEMIQIMQEIMG